MSSGFTGGPAVSSLGDVTGLFCGGEAAPSAPPSPPMYRDYGSDAYVAMAELQRLRYQNRVCVSLFKDGTPNGISDKSAAQSAAHGTCRCIPSLHRVHRPDRQRCVAFPSDKWWHAYAACACMRMCVRSFQVAWGYHGRLFAFRVRIHYAQRGGL